MDILTSLWFSAYNTWNNTVDHSEQNNLLTICSFFISVAPWHSGIQKESVLDIHWVTYGSYFNSQMNSTQTWPYGMYLFFYSYWDDAIMIFLCRIPSTYLWIIIISLFNAQLQMICAILKLKGFDAPHSETILLQTHEIHFACTTASGAVH